MLLIMNPRSQALLFTQCRSDRLSQLIQDQLAFFVTRHLMAIERWICIQLNRPVNGKKHPFNDNRDNSLRVELSFIYVAPGPFKSPQKNLTTA